MVKLSKSGKKSLFSKKPKKDDVVKKSFNWNEFAKSFQSLDQNNYGSWPIAVKITVLLFIMAMVGLFAYALPIRNKMEEIRSAETEQATLLEQYRTKESKARHLKEYKAQVAQMEADFTELLNQLPKDTRISDLVEGINTVGVTSSIRFHDISVEPEVQQEFFIEQPIKISAIGDYHEFGDFISGLAKLPRIITLHDFEVNNTKPTLEQLPELTLTLQAKTYRSKELTEEDLKKATSANANPANGGAK